MPQTPACAAAALAALLNGPIPARATEAFAATELVWVGPAASRDGARPCARPVVLHLPRDWVPGDALAVVLPGTSEALPLARPLVEALLDQETAVAVFPAEPAEGCLAGRAEPVGEVLGAASDLQVQTGAGLMVAIGLGASGAAVLAAATEAVAERYLPRNGPRLAAAAALGDDGPASIVAGASPPASERWRERAPLLCAALAAATGQVEAASCLATLGATQPLAGLGDPPGR